MSAPSVGYAIGEPQRIEARASVVEAGETLVLQNQYVRAVFQRDGHLFSLYDLQRNRECITPASAPIISSVRRLPEHLRRLGRGHFPSGKAHQGRRSHAGAGDRARPLRSSVEFTYLLTPTSSLTQTISLTAISPHLEFANEVEWHEQHKFLKVSFRSPAFAERDLRDPIWTPAAANPLQHQLGPGPL